MPRSQPLNRTAQQVTSNPLNNMFFDPTNIAKTIPDYLTLPTPADLAQTMLENTQKWTASVNDFPQLIEQTINTLLQWLDDVTGINLIGFQTGLNSITAALQQSWVNFQQLINGIAGEIDSDVNDALAVWNTLSGDFTASAEAFSTLLSSWWTALEDDTGITLINAWETAWNTYISTVTEIETDEQITITQFFDALLGISTVNTGQVIGVTETIYPRPGGNGLLRSTAKATKFLSSGPASGHGTLAGPIGFIRELPVIGTNPDIFSKGTLSATARAYQYRIPVQLTGRGALVALVPELITISFIVGVKEFVYVDLFGHGTLAATATVKEFILAPHLSGQGVLSGRVQEFFSVTASNIDSIGMDFFGHGQLSATATVKEFILPAAPSGRGALTAIIPGYISPSFILGVKQYLYIDQFGHGVLTATATVKQFTLAPNTAGHGLLTAQVNEDITFSGGAVPIVSIGMDFFGHGQLTSTAVVKEFILPATLSGKGALVGLVPGVTTSSFVQGIKETIVLDIFGHGTLTTTVRASQFKEAIALSGHGSLVGLVPDVTSSSFVVGQKYGILSFTSGRGVLTATAVSTKAIVAVHLSGRGSTASPVGGPSIGSFDQALLNALEDALTGNLTGTLSQLQAAFNDLMALLGSPTALGTGSPVPSAPTSTPLFGTLVAATNPTVANDIFGGSTFWSSLMSLLFPNAGGAVGAAVASASVAGLLGPTDIGSSLQASVDSLWNALTNPTTYQSGNSLQNLASAAQNLWSTLFGSGAVVETTTTNSNAITAQALGNVASTAVDTSANAVFPISQINGSSPTTITVDQADSAIGYILVPSAGTKETVIWLGQTQGTLSSFVINLYEVDTSNGALNYLFSSGDIHGSLSGTLGWNYWNISNSVSEDAVGAGVNTSNSVNTNVTWSHTLGPSANMLLVNVSFTSTIGFSNFPNMTVSCGISGPVMTLLAAVNCNNVGSNGFNAVFYLANPPTGTQTIFLQPGGPGTNLFANFSANSVSYIGVASLGTPVTNHGSSTSPTTGAITTAPGDMVFAGFGSADNTIFSSPSNTQRYLYPSSTNAAEHGNLIQDVVVTSGSSSTLSATLSSSLAWSAIGVNLVASNALAAAQNDVYAVEVTVQGTGYYNMVGIPNHWLPVNTNVFPQSLGATRDSYDPPDWDANGVGSSGGPSATSISWSHTNAANAYLLVAIVEYTLGGSPTHSATYNGVTMTSLGSSVTGSWVKITLFGLAVTAAGTHTVAVSSNQAGYMTGRSTSFTGVSNVVTGSINTTTGSSATPSITVLANTGMVMFGALGSLNAAITITQGNNSWTETNTNADLAGAWQPLVQDLTFGGLGNVQGSMSSTSWVGVGIALAGVELTPGDISAPAYSSDVPWIGIGGTAGITQQVPATTEMASWYGNVNQTTGAYTYTIPGWVISDYDNGQNDLIDIILVGGGAGGNGGTSVGGGGGSWTVVTLTYGTQITGGTTTITGITGPGGAGGSGGGSPTSGAAGSDTTAVVTGYGTLTAAGGTVSGGIGFFGGSPGNQMWNGTNYYGGGEETNINYGSGNGGGNGPGGGGSAGGTISGTNYSGGNGAFGAVWFVARQPG